MRPKTYTIDRPQASASVTEFSDGLPASQNTFEVDYRMPEGSYSYPVTIKNNGDEDLSTFDATIIGQDIYGQKLEETVDLTTATGTATTTGLFSSISRIQTDVTGKEDPSGYQPTTDISLNVAAIAAISDGKLDITIDGTLTQVEGIDFSGDATTADIAATLVTDLAALDVTITEASDIITFTSDSTGTGSSILVAAGTGTGTNVVDTGLIEMDTAVAGSLTLQVGYAVSSDDQRGIPTNWRGRNLGLAVTPGTGTTYTVEFSYSSIQPYEVPVWYPIDDDAVVAKTVVGSTVLTVPPVMIRVNLTTPGTTDTKLVMNTTDV